MIKPQFEAKITFECLHAIEGRWPALTPWIVVNKWVVNPSALELNFCFVHNECYRNIEFKSRERMTKLISWLQEIKPYILSEGGVKILLL